MVLNLRFVLLSIKSKIKIQNEPSTIYFILNFKNNIGDANFEQDLNCIVTLDDIIDHGLFDKGIKESAKIFKTMSRQTNKEWLNAWIEFRNQITTVLMSNTKVMIELSY